MDAKEERERQFHNAAFSDNRRSAIVPAYAVMHDSRVFYERFIRERAAGARVLEYGCGATAMASLVAGNAAEVIGIDISDVAVDHASQRAREAGIKATYRVMDAQALEFPDASFDLICSVAVLHHLDLARAFREIARTLKPTGQAIFIEPLGHNPLINLYRWSTPTLRTPDEHPLLAGDLALARDHFSNVEIRYFALSSLLAMPLHGTRLFKSVLYRLEAFDQFLFRMMPWTRRYAWQVVMVLSGPRKTEPQAIR